MERSQLFDLMGELQLYGMKAAFDEIMTTAVKRQHEPQRVIGDLLTAEINEKQARSIKYQLTIAKLPLAKDLDDFQFEGTPINETLVRDLAGGGLIAQQRNAVLVGGTGTGKTHLAIAIARSCIRAGSRGRFYNVVDLVNRLETEARNARQGRLAEHLTRMDFVILDELGYLPFAHPASDDLHLLEAQPDHRRRDRIAIFGLGIPASANRSRRPPNRSKMMFPACFVSPCMSCLPDRNAIDGRNSCRPPARVAARDDPPRICGC